MSPGAAALNCRSACRWVRSSTNPAAACGRAARFKACLPGGASTPYFTAEHWDVPMDFDPVAKAGSRLGTGGIVVFDQDTCMVAATLNLIRFYARESCGWCTPCREGLPFVSHVLETIEAGQGSEEHIAILQEHVKLLNYAFCALAPGAMGPVDGLLRHFKDEVQEHIVKQRCPFQIGSMPKLIIDNIAVEVAEGVTVLEAAQSVGIPIPHFCWHPALGKAGACRVCAVKMVDGPVKGIQMSCMLPAQDGMVVSTTDPEAMAMRRQVIEWLMINHPHDCPVCDEGGECQLQDFTIAGGHGLRRYTGKKRTHRNQYLGPYIEHEMNRCIQCYRCVRFYQEFAGGTDFGVMGSAGRIYYGRVEDGQLESPFSGNLVDICPTGVFTDKTARFRARYWDYDMAPSVCPHCSLGCNTVPGRPLPGAAQDHRPPQRRGQRLVYLRSGAGSPTAPSTIRPAPGIRWWTVGRSSWDEALDTLQLRINEIGEAYGPGTLAIVGSSRLAMEAASLLHMLAGCTAAGSLCYFVDEQEAARPQQRYRYLNEATSRLHGGCPGGGLIAIVDVRPAAGRADDGPGGPAGLAQGGEDLPGGRNLHAGGAAWTPL